MRKSVLAVISILFLSVLIPVKASACGGFVAVKGEKIFHSVYCDDVEGLNLKNLRWYDTAKKAESAGLKMCKKCAKFRDDDFDSAYCPMYFESADPLTITAMELSLEKGREIGEESGYQTAYDDFYNGRYEAGYQEGYDLALSEGKKIVAELEEKNGKRALTMYFISIIAVSASIFIYIFGRARISELKAEADGQIYLAQAEAKKIREQSGIEASKIRESALKEISVARNNLKLVTEETRQRHPELARQIADVQYYLDMNSYNQLLSKQHPAVRAADELKRIAKEKRELTIENKQLQYQIDFFETLFPWLEEFKEVPSDEAISYATGVYDSDYDAVRRWISPDEYAKLDNTAKYQLALDKWKSRKKNDWDIGIEYERYIGYRLECSGYKVTYLGATLGLKDMGRDLLAKKDGKTLVIQCKRWAKAKTIHEKHIFQLYGSTAVLSNENPGVKYEGVFITTATLSETAKKCAKYCGISVVEMCPMEDYPLIKCNTSKTGEKIYHLPFDQQYDKVIISKNSKSFYAWTTREAESKGFRRAYRWHPSKT